MKASRFSLWLFIAVIGLTIVAAPLSAQDDCANLAKQKMDHVTITSAVFMNDPEGFRLFVVPDFGMCPSMYPGTFDALGTVQKWVEEDDAPDQIITTYFDQSSRFRARAGMQDAPESAATVKKTRPVCAYPEVAIYKGSGDTNDAANFECGKPTW